MITAGGKNIAPQNIENLLKADSRISQAVVLGDRKPYLVALIAVTPEARDERSESEVNMLVESIIAQANLELPRFEQVRKFRLLPYDLSEVSGELTPTLKVKRRVVADKFAHLIDEMYD
jgi:long-chain acyl-CoA synthetase